VFVEINEKLIANDCVQGFETFSGGRLLLLRGGGVWDRGKRGREETMGVGDAATGAIGRKKWFTGLHEILSRGSLIVRPYG
jgi:hypothetical protein